MGRSPKPKEQLGGYYLINAKDLNDALQIAAKIPGARTGTVEVRPIQEFSWARSVSSAGTGGDAAAVRAVIDEVYRTESRRVLATLIRLLGDFERAEEALHDAFSAAVEQWPRDGIPASPRAWLVSAGRFRAIDALRRRARFDASLAALAAELEGQTAAPVE